MPSVAAYHQDRANPLTTPPVLPVLSGRDQVSLTPCKRTARPIAAPICAKAPCDCGNRMVDQRSAGTKVSSLKSPVGGDPGGPACRAGRRRGPWCSKLITAEETEMPRSRSTAIQSERTRRRSLCALTSAAAQPLG